MGFSLTKWYLDLVTDDGRVAIAYWAEVRWKRLRQPLCGLLLHPGGTAIARWRFSGRSVAEPVLDAQGLRWNAEPLALTVEAARREPAFRHRLLDSARGVIDWYCEVPRADVRLRAGDTALEGTGYVERLELTVLPWRIPADEIRWGRFLGPGTSVVWIDWRGDVPQQLVFQDGRIVRAGTVSDEAIRFGDDVQLDLRDRHVISADTLGGLIAPLEALRPLVNPVARTFQTRWLSRGELHGPATTPGRGWALHELVKRT